VAQARPRPPGEDVDAICRIAIDRRLDALIVSNHHRHAPAAQVALPRRGRRPLRAPLKDLALQRLRDFRSASGGAIPLIGVGGIATAEDAWQANPRGGEPGTALYRDGLFGPGLARRINRDLVRLMDRDGFASIADAVGSE
jgi:dihydroorotate dehydrogenase